MSSCPPKESLHFLFFFYQRQNAGKSVLSNYYLNKLTFSHNRRRVFCPGIEPKVPQQSGACVLFRKAIVFWDLQPEALCESFAAGHRARECMHNTVFFLAGGCRHRSRQQTTERQKAGKLFAVFWPGETSPGIKYWFCSEGSVADTGH